MTPVVEAVCCTYEDCVIASRSGAKRVELCSAIELGGLSASPGLARQVADVLSMSGALQNPPRVIAMIRPRPGGFIYSDSEFGTMVRECSSLENCHGYAFGILDEDQEIDRTRTKQLSRSVRSLLNRPELVFHRAFDSVPDQSEALEILIDLGFTRVMTSGKASSASEGADAIKRLIDQASGRIEVMPAGGIRASNVLQVLATGCSSIHLGPFKDFNDRSGWGPYRVLDEAEVTAVAHLAREHITSS